MLFLCHFLNFFLLAKLQLLILSISNDNRINKVDTRIHHVYDDDEFDNLNVPLISYDFDNARNACMAVVVRDTYNPIKETDLGEIGVRELMEIVGLNEFQKPVVDALKKHSLRKSNTVGGLKAGSYYESPTKIIQIESNEYGIIQTIWIKIGDHNAEKTKIFDSISFASSREQVQYFLGHPSRFGDFWDRYDYKKLCLHFQYSGQNEVINMLTIMVPSVAPAYSPKEE